MMLSVQYIIGQLNSPLLQLIDFIKQFQDAKISLERLGEIHDKDDEENKEEQYSHEIRKKTFWWKMFHSDIQVQMFRF
jgi:ATP-binding cassette subfamily B protein